MTLWEKFGDSVFTMLTDETSRIVKFSPIDRITESKRNFRWIRPLENIDKYILQYIVGDSVLTDLVYCSKSRIPNAEYG